MNTFQLGKLLRPNIRSLVPYTSARNEYSGAASVFLDANENAFGGAAGNLYQRYPDPMQQKLKQEVGRIKGIDPAKIFLGNGSDEAIDLLIRAVCEPAKDNILIFPPTYGMYGVSAQINDVAVKEVMLTEDFQIDIPRMLGAIDLNTRLVFFCSPNNPTGNLLHAGAIEKMLAVFGGLVVVDEAYIDFSDAASWINALEQYPNLVVLQTFSKAWGMAGLRLGMAFASGEITGVLNNIKAPYNISQAAQQISLQALGDHEGIDTWIRILREERARLSAAIAGLPFVERVYPSDANFLLVRAGDAHELYRFLLARQIVVRNRSTQPGCAGCLRITVGTPQENDILLAGLTAYAEIKKR